MGAALLAAALFAPSCGVSNAVGRRAASGALDEAREESNRRREAGMEAPIEQMSRNAMRGAMSELDDPRRQAELRRFAEAAAEGALASAIGRTDAPGAWGGGPAWGRGEAPASALGARFSEGFTWGMSRQLQLELGMAGDGPLAASLSGLAERISAAAAGAVVDEISAPMGPCAGLDRGRCAEQQVRELGRSAAAGFAEGMAASMRAPLLALAFSSGVIAALLVALVARRLKRDA